MKIIFLDIDGVLNNFQTFREIHFEEQLTGVRRVAIDPDKVALLKEIVDYTDAKIVLISDWRKYGKMKKGKFVTKNENLSQILDILEFYNLFIYDVTPKVRGCNREVEIRKWLENKDIEKYIIIDDEEYDLQGFTSEEIVKTYFIKTDQNGDGIKDLSGLTKEHVEEAIKKLNNDKKLTKRVVSQFY